MARKIRRAAVLGAGTMGTGIATHLAGMGVDTLLLDIVPPDLPPEKKKDPLARNQIAAGALKTATKAKPPAFHRPDDADRIQIGNFEDDMAKIADCDWVIEVVVENIAIKQKLYEQVEQHRKPGSLITSNTSGLSLQKLCEGRSEDFVKHFFVTHFFNPVRFMPLLELVATDKTAPEAIETLQQFGFEVLGKGIVFGKDTPNFVANRIGVYGLMYTLQTFRERGLSLAEVDAIFGPVMGRPKSAVFRTADLVGIDVLAHVARNCYDSLPDDECRDTFKVPDFVEQMIEKKLLGQKTKAGFYKKQGKDICALDFDAFEYKPSEKVRADSIGKARKVEDTAGKIKKLMEGDDKLAQYAWEVTSRTLIYAANRMGEICDDIVNCDRGMQWGFNWELGPFETWDALGVEETIARMEKDGLTVPAWVNKMVGGGQTSFYGGSVSKPTYFDVPSSKMKEVPLDPRTIRVAALKEANKVVKKNGSATVYDMDDGILLVEFNTKMNVVDIDVEQMLLDVVELAENDGWNGIVIGNDHKQAFSAGANLFALVMAINQKMWDDIESMIAKFQQGTMRLRYSDIPVVAAPSGLALGGGCEVMMGADAVRAHVDLFTGLVEVAVGLIPAAGGCLRMLERHCGHIPDDPGLDPMPFISEAFKLIAMAKVTAGAHEAKLWGVLRDHDQITANRALLLHDAKQTALGMARAGYQRPRPKKFRLPGESGAANLRWFVDNMRRGNQVSDHDAKIAGKLARVLCGGDTSTRVKVDEQQILDLEREAFMSLCGEPKSQERIQHMLTAKKPLRN